MTTPFSAAASHLSPAELEECRETYASRSGLRNWNRMMRVVRRVHLYSGLFLFPWVLLYGVTAMLFNHPGVFPEQTLATFPAAETGSPLFGLPSAGETANQVVAALQTQHPARFGDLAVSAESLPFYPFGAAVTAKGPDAEYNLSVELTDGSGVLRVKPVVPPDGSVPFAGGVPVSVPSPLVDRVTEGTKSVLAERGFNADAVTFRGPPDLYFQVTSSGETWPVKYNAVTGTVSSVEPMSWRRYFLRLHTAHHFPSAIGPRWFWAVAVDVMFVAMVFWGLSGLLMWWQIKSVRWVGLVTVVTGAAMALWMVIAMHGAMIN
jgi:hypothetical protein